ncbi:MAG: hypothetical protein KGJ66_02260 [Alphaproteobacteria bacterium]|nr:hypothetical protein [Alphaproteobacteria bacterium]
MYQRRAVFAGCSGRIRLGLSAIKRSIPATIGAFADWRSGRKDRVDWVWDDEPAEIKTAHGPLVTLPYTVEPNDIPMMVAQHHHADVFLKRAIDQFDRLYAESAARAKILCFAIHPYISGVPHRIKYLEAFLDYAARHAGVAFWHGAHILDWYRGAKR